MNRIIKTLPIGDLHLGHKQNPTSNKIYNLDKWFFDDNVEEMKTLDILILMGDEFDRIILNGTEEFDMIMSWFAKLFLFCKKYNIKIRIVEGTESHSYKQMKIVKNIIRDYQIDVDVKYFETLFIEHMEEFDIDILYVPDELNNNNAEETYKQVLELMKEKGLTKVDLAFFHGQFHFQLPMVKSKASHTEENYLNIVRYFISTGHIHTPMIYDRIVGEGSFDRDTHGQEEPKGAFVFTLHPDGVSKSSYKFYENKLAMKFTTIKVETEDLEVLYRQINSTSKGYAKRSHIRLHMASNNPLFKMEKLIKQDFPQFTIKIEDNSKDSKIKSEESLLVETTVELVKIDKNNITDLIDKELEVYHLDSEEEEIKNSILSKIL